MHFPPLFIFLSPWDNNAHSYYNFNCNGISLPTPQFSNLAEVLGAGPSEMPSTMLGRSLPAHALDRNEGIALNFSFSSPARLPGGICLGVAASSL